MPPTASQPRFRTGHHIVLALLILTGSAIVLLRLASGWHTAPEPERTDAIQLRLDPNTATAQELAAMPGIGPRLAEHIVAYRTREAAAGRRPVFREPADLDAVEGLGKQTIDNMAPYLSFPGSPAAAGEP